MLCAMSHWVMSDFSSELLSHHEHVTPWLAESDSEPGTCVGNNSVNINLRGPLLFQGESV